MPDWLMAALFSGAVTGLVTWGGVRTELRYMKRDIKAAHARLDKVRAPSAWVDMPGV